MLALALPAVAAVQWYQQYQRGLELAEAGEWEAALAELDGAAAVENRPREQVRTYGREFLFRYDPPFHQARCLLELGRLTEAAERLAVSRSARVTPQAEIDALARRLEEARATAQRLTAPVPPAASSLRVDSRPSGARVVLDGTPIGRTPLSARELAAARHRLTVEAEGYEAWDETIRPAPGELLHLQVVLRPAPQLPASLPAPATSSPGSASEELPAAEGRQDQALAESGRAQPAETRRTGAAPPLPFPPSAERSADRVEAEPEGASGQGPEPAGGSGEPADSPAAVPDPITAPARRSTPWLPWLGTALALAVAVYGLRRWRGSRTAPERRLAGYAIQGELGRGGMATTYRAVRLADRLPVALKIPHESGDANFHSRFLREGRLGETLHHPRIVRILEAGEAEGRLFLAMELLSGHTLAEEIRRFPMGLPVPRAIELAHDICEALDYAHAKGVIHRDLKPENIMIREDGLKVMDFGVARIEGDPSLTTSRFFFGSPLYSAPELVDPSSIDHRADLYSLGIVLFELLEGQPPFRHESVFRLLEMHQKTPLPELSREMPAELAGMVRRLCAKSPDERYPSAQAVLVDLKRLLLHPAPPVADPDEPVAADQGAASPA